MQARQHEELCTTGRQVHCIHLSEEDSHRACLRCIQVHCCVPLCCITGGQDAMTFNLEQCLAVRPSTQKLHTTTHGVGGVLHAHAALLQLSRIGTARDHKALEVMIRAVPIKCGLLALQALSWGASDLTTSSSVKQRPDTSSRKRM